jgi:hypothetical protein
MKSANAVPVTQTDLMTYADRANGFINLVEWAPTRAPVISAEPSTGRPRFRSSIVADVAMSEKMSVMEVAKVISKDNFLVNPDMFTLLDALRSGIKLGMHVSDAYEKHSGLADLVVANAANRLSDTDKATFRAKNQTKAAIAVFVMSSYALWKLSSYKTDDVERVKAVFDGLPEMPLITVPSAMKCILFYFGRVISKAETGLDALKLAKLYFARVMSDIKLTQFEYSESFASITYKLEGEDFTVQGFESQETGAATVVEFKRVVADDIIGNHEMKRVLTRLSQFVIAYDFEREMNPFVEFEAMNWLGVLQGWAGTGKSMGLSFLQTLVFDHCKALGLPFQLCPIPNAVVQSLQGESAKVYEDWWKRMSNSRFICVAPVDDSEAVYLDRRGQSSSEGSKLVVMSHLRLTEGSTAFYKGNVLQPHATNNADMIDPPVFSRYQFRIVVPGAQTREDYCDQMRRFGDRFNQKTASNVIDLQFPPDYAFLSNQGLIAPDEKKVEAFVKFQNEGLQRLWEDVERKKLGANSYDLYGTFFAALHQKFEQFTSRDVRNITLNTASRLFGFDFPTEWLTNRDMFVAKDYDTKKKMILDAALQLQNGLTADQVLFQETMHYTESTIAMLDSGRQYRIRQQANDLLERKQAMEIAEKEWAQRQPDTKAA